VLTNQAMATKVLHDALKQAETWPVAVQEELAVIARAMDAALKGGVYRATLAGLAGIDPGLAEARVTALVRRIVDWPESAAQAAHRAGLRVDAQATAT